MTQQTGMNAEGNIIFIPRPSYLPTVLIRMRLELKGNRWAA